MGREAPAQSDPPAHLRQAPATVAGRLRHLGPGLIVTASIVGSGELIMTTKWGAETGFTLLWLVVIGCIVKVFVQIELGRYALTSGETTLRALVRLPGVIWLWLAMYVSLFFQLSGIAGSLARIFLHPFPASGELLWLLVVTVSVALLLGWGRYRAVEAVSIGMVFLFTTSTILAVLLLQWTPHAIRASQILEGFSFRMADPQGTAIAFTTAFAAFGITGVGASELIYYPYWCLEKGYARFVGPCSESPDWEARARGWIQVLKLDAWISLVVYTTATVAFYLLGAAVLHARGLEVGDTELIETLSHIYRESLGPAGMGIFLVGAFFVLYSTLFAATASNARLFADALHVFGLARYPTDQARKAVIRWAGLLMPFLVAGIYAGVGKPVTLVTVGALAQACMLPVLGGAALYLLYRRSDRRLAPGPAWTACLWISFLAMLSIGLYQLWQQASGFARS